MKIQKLVGFLLAAYVPCCWALSPCDSINRSISESEKVRLAPILAKQLKRHLDVTKVSVLQAFKYGTWQIYYVEPQDWDAVYLFFSNDPEKIEYLNLWGGVARPEEEADVLSWTNKKVPGIPSTLAKCFAYHVTQESGKQPAGKRTRPIASVGLVL